MRARGVRASGRPRWSVLVPMLWLALAAAPANAVDWAITNVSPNPVKAGCDVTLTGTFRPTQETRQVQLGQGMQMGSPVTVKTWSANSITVSLPATAPAGNSWLAIIKGDMSVAVKSANLQVLAGPCSGSPPSSGASIRPKVGYESGIRGPKRIDSGPAIDFAVTPKIHRVGPDNQRDFEIRPGSQLEIEGESFGVDAGRVYFKIPGHVDVPREMGNPGWVSASKVLATVPSDILRDVPVHAKIEFQLESASGRKSAWFRPRYTVSTHTAVEFATRPIIQVVTGPDGIGSGKDFVIEGSNFGARPGKVVMRMAGDGAHYVVSDVVWESSKRIRGKVPTAFGTRGTKEGTEVGFSVVTHDGEETNWYTTPFDVTLDEIALPWSSGWVRACGNSDTNVCNGVGRDVPWKLADASVRGYHRQDFDRIGNDDGHDEFQFRLYNGWVISGVQAALTRSSGDESITAMSADDALRTLRGKSEATIRVDWSVSPNDYVMYEYKLWIKGPRGIPYHCQRGPSDCKVRD